MKIEIKNESHKHILFLDCEYDRENLKQIAGILFKKKGELYELLGSNNIYIKDNEKLDRFFVDFTAITPQFLNTYGVKLSEAKEEFRRFIQDKEDLLIVSHNLKVDSNILFKNGFDLSPYDHYCT